MHRTNILARLANPLTPSCPVTVGIVVSEGGNFEKGFVGFPRCSGRMYPRVTVDPPTGFLATSVKTLSNLRMHMDKNHVEIFNKDL